MINCIRQLFLIFLLLTLSGCFSDPPLRWEESVVLPDRRVIVLKREQHFDERGFVAAHSFEFEHPETKQIVKWHSNAALYAQELPLAANWQKRPTDGFFSLVALFIVQDVPHILVRPTFGGHTEAAGCPNPVILVYRYSENEWQQVPYAKSPIRNISNNTTIDPKADRDYITRSRFKIPAGGVRKLGSHVDKQLYGIDLDKFPTQVFECPKQKRFDFK